MPVPSTIDPLKTPCAYVMDSLNRAVQGLTATAQTRESLDTVYKDVCAVIKGEMDRRLQHKTVVLKEGLSNKRRKGQEKVVD